MGLKLSDLAMQFVFVRRLAVALLFPAEFSP
jgi:hypothetical protein